MQEFVTNLVKKGYSEAYIMATVDQHKEFRIADEKFRRGDHITDEQLGQLLKVYTILDENLGLLGERHHLEWKDIHMELIRLEDMKSARGKNRKLPKIIVINK